MRPYEGIEDHQVEQDIHLRGKLFAAPWGQVTFPERHDSEEQSVEDYREGIYQHDGEENNDDAAIVAKRRTAKQKKRRNDAETYAQGEEQKKDCCLL